MSATFEPAHHPPAFPDSDADQPSQHHPDHELDELFTLFSKLPATLSRRSVLTHPSVNLPQPVRYARRQRNASDSSSSNPSPTSLPDIKEWPSGR
jgi:hypothetical protein